LLTYFIETYNSSRAIVWLKMPSLSAKATTVIYMYYCNPAAPSVSDPANTFLFYDGFESLAGWTDLGSGTVSLDNSTFPGVSSLKKEVNCDPSGAYKLLGQTISSFRLITREQRRSDGFSCRLNRYGLEGTGFNG